MVAACDLRSQREEQFVQAFFGEEIANQVRSSFRQNHLTRTCAANSLEDRSGTEHVSAFYGSDLNPGRQILLPKVALAVCVVTIKTGIAPIERPAD